MRKIPTLFQRNYETDRLVMDIVTPGCEWVLAEEGIATKKWDGTSILVRDGCFYKRYDAKKGRTPPAGFEPAQDAPDPVTGHFPGWLPVDWSKPDDRYCHEAFCNWMVGYHPESFGGSGILGRPVPDGTYELIGPKIQGNPERCERHILVPHGVHRESNIPRDFAALRAYLAETDTEGIVWWRDIDNPDCDKVKLKKKDFGFTR